jgi:hypothetical protein
VDLRNARPQAVLPRRHETARDHSRLLLIPRSQVRSLHGPSVWPRGSMRPRGTPHHGSRTLATAPPTAGWRPFLSNRTRMRTARTPAIPVAPRARSRRSRRVRVRRPILDTRTTASLTYREPSRRSITARRPASLVGSASPTSSATPFAVGSAEREGAARGAGGPISLMKPAPRSSSPCRGAHRPARDRDLGVGPGGHKYGALDPMPHQGSHVITSLCGADAMAWIPAREGGLRAGEPVAYSALP